MLAKDQDISGPRFLHGSDRPEDYHCKICSLPPERTFDELIAHYTSIHKYKMIDYLLDDVRFIEVDEAGYFSERGQKIMRERSLKTAS